MNDGAILDRFQRVKPTGPGRYIACCPVPGHDDRNPSLSIRRTDDGRWLLKCHAECPTEDVLGAVGLTFSDLFPPKLESHRKRGEAWHVEDVLRSLVSEAQIAAIVAARVAYGYDVDLDEIDRLFLAVQRIANAATAAGVDHEERRVRERLQRNRKIAEAVV